MKIEDRVRFIALRVMEKYPDATTINEFIEALARYDSISLYYNKDTEQLDCSIRCDGVYYKLRAMSTTIGLDLTTVEVIKDDNKYYHEDSIYEIPAKDLL